jgi:DNA-binding transcriptional MerR regulator
MRVGEVARESGVSVRSIRYYESAGLLLAARGANGYRTFDAAAVERARLIRDLLRSGFTVEEVSSLSACLQAGPGDTPCCARTVAMYREKLARIDEQMRVLRELRGRIRGRIAALEPCS